MRARPLALFALAVVSCAHAPPRAPLAAPPAASKPAPPAPPAFGAADVDAMLRAGWARAGIAPASRVDDARWLRRVYIDVVGTIPPPAAVTAFVDDPRPNKREAAVDALLASPAYAEHWKTYWDDELLGPTARAQDLDRVAFRRWLRARFAENAPWDRMVRELVAATGVNGTGEESRARDPFAKDDGPEAPGVNGAVNWVLRYQAAPQDLAGAASKTFLAVQIQCAQCHDHKTEAWKQKDFWSFAAALARTRPERLDDDATMGKVRRVELVDLPSMPPRYKKDGDLAALFTSKPTALDGTALPEDATTRRALAAWMTSARNPYFSRALVNRMWGHFFGRGFADPVNDMRPSNPPVMEPLLQELADDFAAHGFDVKRLVRTLALTDAYALAPAAPAKGDPENKLWSRFRLAPLGPEELLNAIAQATGLEATMRKSGGNVDQLRAQLARSYTFLFDVDEDADAPSFDGTVSQALALINGALVGAGSAAIPGGALDAALSATPDDARRIEAIYLRTLSRAPTRDELAAWTAYVDGAPAPGAAASAPPPGGARAKKGDPLGRLERRAASASGGDPKRAAYEDLVWALLNSSEFAFNH